MPRLQAATSPDRENLCQPLQQDSFQRRSKPSRAVIATEDKAFDQAMLVHMAERIGAKVTKVSASHALFMTQPKAVADTIDSAAREAAWVKKD